METNGCVRNHVTRHITRGYSLGRVCVASNTCEKCDVVTGRSFATVVEVSACGYVRGRCIREESVWTNNPAQNPPSVALSILKMNIAWRQMRRTFLNFCLTVRHRSRGSLGVFNAGVVVDVHAPGFACSVAKIFSVVDAFLGSLRRFFGLGNGPH